MYRGFSTERPFIKVHNRFRGMGFSEELLYAAIRDRPEVEAAEIDGTNISCRLKDEYIQRTEPLRELTQEEADIMLCDYKKQTEHRDALKVQSREVLAEIM